MESCDELNCSSSVTNNHKSSCTGSTWVHSAISQNILYCLARSLLAQLGSVDKGVSCPPIPLLTLLGHSYERLICSLIGHSGHPSTWSRGLDNELCGLRLDLHPAPSLFSLVSSSELIFFKSAYVLRSNHPSLLRRGCFYSTITLIRPEAWVSARTHSYNQGKYKNPTSCKSIWDVNLVDWMSLEILHTSCSPLILNDFTTEYDRSFSP